MNWLPLCILLLLVSCNRQSQQDYSLFNQKLSAPSQIVYIAKNTSIEKGITLYLQHLSETKNHNNASLRALANMIILKGIDSPNPRIQIMGLFAAKMAKAEHLTFNISPLIKSPYFEVQQTTLDTLSQFENEIAIQTLFQAFSSDFLFTRLQGAYLLARQKRTNALSQIEALMHKSPIEAKPYFCELFATIGGGYALQVLNNALTDPNPLVKTQAIIQAAINHREELKEPILQVATHTNPIEQEAAAFAIGEMGIEEGIAILQNMLTSPYDFVCLNAANSLYHLGQLDANISIQKYAEQDDLFALKLLGFIFEAKPLLVKKLQSDKLDVRINSTLSLLQQKQIVPLKNIIEALFLNHNGFAYNLSFSPAHTLSAIKIIPNYEILSHEDQRIFSLNQNIKQMIMQLVYQLPEDIFLQVAREIIYSQLDDLIPITCVMLANLQSLEAIELLKQSANAIGNPLLRGSALLSLYRLNKEPNIGEKLKQFAKKELEKSIFELRGLFFGELPAEKKRFELTAEERTALLLETIYTLAEENHDQILTLLIEGLKTTKEDNRYILAGLILSLL